MGIGVETLDLRAKRSEEAQSAKRFGRLLAPFGDVYIHADYLLPAKGPASDQTAAYLRRLTAKFGSPRFDPNGVNEPPELGENTLPDPATETDARNVLNAVIRSRAFIVKKPVPIDESKLQMSQAERNAIADNAGELSFFLRNYTGQLDVEKSAWAGEPSYTGYSFVFGNLARRHFKFDNLGVTFSDGMLLKKSDQYFTSGEILSLDELAGTQLVLEVCPELDVDDHTITLRNRKLELAHSLDVRDFWMSFPNQGSQFLISLDYPDKKFIRKVAVPDEWNGESDFKPVDANYSECSYYFYRFPQEKKQFEKVFTRRTPIS